MKHTLTTVICITIIIALGASVVAIDKSDNARAYIQHLKDSAVQAARDKAQAITINQEKARLAKECDKENVYYNSLTVKQKATVEAPNCNLQIVE